MVDSSQPLVSIIVVNYNGRAFIEDCLASLQMQDYRNREIIVVDNGSSDGSEQVIKEYTEVRLIRNAINEGFVGGVYRALQSAHGEFVVLFNSDAQAVAPDCLSKLLVPLLNGQAVISMANVPPAYQTTGGLNFAGVNIPNVFPEPRNEIFYASGCVLAINHRQFPCHFERFYFAYYEDVALSWAARLQGLRVVFVPEAPIKHLGHASAKRLSLRFRTFLGERNRLATLFIYFGSSTLRKVFPLIVLHAVARFFFFFLARRHPVGIIQAYVWIFTHWRLIQARRRQVQESRKVGDNVILRWFTSRLVQGRGVLSSIVNSLSKLYCRIMKLPVIELSEEVTWKS